MIAIPESITAPRLRLILLGAMVLLIVAGVGVFYFGYSQLSKAASETGAQAANAKQSETTIQRLDSLQKELELRKDTVFMTSRVTADSENYAYQDRLVNDLTIYANRANLVIKNINFSNQAAPASTPPAPATGSPTGGVTAAPAALKKATVDITLENPVNYEDLLNFLHYIEQNLTKLKVSNVVMTKSGSKSVTIDILNLEVYLK